MTGGIENLDKSRYSSKISAFSDTTQIWPAQKIKILRKAKKKKHHFSKKLLQGVDYTHQTSSAKYQIRCNNTKLLFHRILQTLLDTMKRKEEKKDSNKNVLSPDNNPKTSSGEPKQKQRTKKKRPTKILMYLNPLLVSA